MRSREVAVPVAIAAGIPVLLGASWVLSQTVLDTPSPAEQVRVLRVDDAGAPRDHSRVQTLRVDDAGDPYERSDWPHWRVVRDTGCDAREWTLRERGNEVVIGSSCRALSGEWIDAWTRQVLTEPSEIDADHIVSLSDAHRSGGWRWEEERRQEFANDPANIALTAASVNRSKSDQTPGVGEDYWLPSDDLPGDCPLVEPYVDRYLSIKDKYDLTITSKQRSKILDVLVACQGSEQ